MTLDDTAPGIIDALPADASKLSAAALADRLALPLDTVHAIVCDLTGRGVIGSGRSRGGDGVVRTYVWRLVPAGNLAAGREFARTGRRPYQATQCTLVSADVPALQLGSGEVALTFF